VLLLECMNGPNAAFVARNTRVELKQVDILSDVLRALQLRGAIFLDARFTAPWCAVSKTGHRDTGFFAKTEHIVFFHILMEGNCRARLLATERTIELQAGDLMLLVHDDPHIIGSDLELEPVDADTLVVSTPAGGLMQIGHGGGGELTRFLCGYLACDKRLCGLLLEALPRLVHISFGATPAAAWLTNLMTMGQHETSIPRPGGELALAKLSELLFVEAVRRHVDSLSEENTGWLAGLRDRSLSKALALMHARPEYPWSVDELSSRVGTSRTALAQRFVELVGQPPMQYLTRWRLIVAAQRLRRESISVDRIAEQVGYESQAAFNRAFKREFGVPPGRWRKEASEAVTPAKRYE
jgi:AraC family transcriptional regulator, alkane utilization regulator